MRSLTIGLMMAGVCSCMSKRTLPEASPSSHPSANSSHSADVILGIVVLRLWLMSLSTEKEENGILKLISKFPIYLARQQRNSED
jgi:hypothetical protein